MEWNFLHKKKASPALLRCKAEELLMQSEDFSPASKNFSISGERNLNRKGLGGEFRQFRNYAGQDRPQDIDWKRSARSDDVLIREREAQTLYPVRIFISDAAALDFRSKPSLPTKHETCAILALAFALWAERQRDPVYYNFQRVNAENLSHILIENSVPFQEKAPMQDTTFFFSDFTQDFEFLEKEIFANITSRNTLLFHCYDPAELELPYRGRIDFKSQNISSLTLNDVSSIREAYLARLSNHQEKLRDYAKGRGWYYRVFRTDQDQTSLFTDALHYIEAAR